MSKHLTYVVTVSFEDKIVSDNDIKEVGENIARAIKNEANGMGIAPENSDTFTKKIVVSERGVIINELDI